MTTTVPAALLAHMGQPATSLCDLLKVGPLSDGSYVGFTNLDIDVLYDDGEDPGLMTYRAHTGMQKSETDARSSGVATAGVESLVAIFPVPGFTQSAIDRGLFDKARWSVYRVNYKDLSMGHMVLPGSGGTLGEQRMKVGGVAAFELRSISDELSQTVVELDSLTCRVKHFGSQDGDEPFPCGYDIEPEWVDGTVTSIGSEATREFTDSGLGQADGYFYPGLVEWLTGDNAGSETEIESFGVGGVVTLQFTEVDAIQVGDTFRIRRDCNRVARDEDHGCKAFFEDDWGLHFRGEPDIPVGDSASLNAPGAGLP